jgi:hypothetical protein
MGEWYGFQGKGFSIEEILVNRLPVLFIPAIGFFARRSGKCRPVWGMVHIFLPKMSFRVLGLDFKYAI